MRQVRTVLALALCIACLCGCASAAPTPDATPEPTLEAVEATPAPALPAETAAPAPPVEVTETPTPEPEPEPEPAFVWEELLSEADAAALQPLTADGHKLYAFEADNVEQSDFLVSWAGETRPIGDEINLETLPVLYKGGNTNLYLQLRCGGPDGPLVMEGLQSSDDDVAWVVRAEIPEKGVWRVNLRRAGSAVLSAAVEEDGKTVTYHIAVNIRKVEVAEYPFMDFISSRDYHGNQNPFGDPRPGSDGIVRLAGLALNDPRLTREEARALREQGAEAVAARINTIGAFIDFLRYNEFYFVNGDIRCQSGDGLVWHMNTLPEEAVYSGFANCGGYANLAEYVLAGDYAEMGTLGMSLADGEGHLVNYFKVGDSYFVMDFSGMFSQTWMLYQNLYLVRVSDLSELAERRSELGPSRRAAVMLLLKDPGNLSTTRNGKLFTLLPEAVKARVEVLYSTPAQGYTVDFIPVPSEIDDFIDRDLTFRIPSIDPEAFPGVEAYHLPEALGGFTLSYAEARALSDAPLEDAAAAVKTVGDMLLYLYGGNYVLQSSDCCLNEGDYQWHFNRSAQTVYASRRGNCGGFAALARVLLDGDYEETGIYSYSMAQGGGHVMCYVKAGGVCYFLDVNNMANMYYAPDAVARMIYAAPSLGAYTGSLYSVSAAVATTGTVDVPGSVLWPSGYGYPDAYQSDCVYQYGSPTWVHISEETLACLEAMRGEAGSAYRNLDDPWNHFVPASEP